MDDAWEAVFRLRLLGFLCRGGGTRLGCGAGLGGAGLSSPVVSTWSYPLGVKQFYLRLSSLSSLSSLGFIFIPKINGAGAGLAGEVLADDT